MSSSLSNIHQHNSGAFAEDPEQEESGLLTELNGVDLVMSLSPKAPLTTAIQHHQQQSHQQNSLITSTANVAAAVAVAHHHHHNLTNLQHLQNLHNQHHNTLLNSSHSTPFSVTDILSPIEESYRKLELTGNPPSPYR